ncbi:usherin [Syngnathus typhle]|uniref:usherin n=1 Tax=Syngnathus typhle TaxID=161592 RepID=UPI002A69DE4F|nr:usherin [Syngnathus typhle]
MLVMRWQAIFFCICVLFIGLVPKPASSQGHFPPMENIGAFKPVSTSPPRFSCGVPDRSVYCRTASSQAELLTCHRASCIQECPYRDSMPPYAPLLLPAYRDACLTEDAKDIHPILRQRSQLNRLTTSMSSRDSRSVVFPQGQQECLLSPPSQKMGDSGSLTLALWIKPSSLGEMMLLEKSSRDQSVFAVTVSERDVSLKYTQSTSSEPLIVSFKTEGRLVVDTWTHIVLQVHDRHASLFLNGLEEDGTPFETQSLPFRLHDSNEDSTMRVGLGSKGSNQFMGRMQDFRFYPATLTNREIVEIYSGVLPQLHSQSECRCPATHPRVHPLVERYCIPNGVEDTTNDRVLRLNLNAHPLAYINDQDMGTMWRSKLMTMQELDEGFTITVDLANGQYQVFYVLIQFAGPLPESLLIQRQRLTDQQNSTNGEQPWLDWQYVAKDCSVFDMQNNGPLLTPDSVNCLQLPSEEHYSGGNITISLLSSEPNSRPGYNDFYNTPSLQEMVHATQVRLHLGGQYHTRAAGVDHRHRHYAVNEITISGRCECHGHADHCDTSVSPYRCLCLAESHTEGNNCQRCASLYNDKPFRPGDQLQPMNCRPCQCHGHAHSCHYEVWADDQPTERYLGGGGVCDNCMHNTTGRNCELCVSGFFRLEQSDATSVHVCQPCECHTAGTVNGSTECFQLGGQCQCKAAVEGRRCADCSPGWYGLQASNPEGCTRCNCSGIGTVISSTGRVASCNRHTGQCRCKLHVTGLSCDRCEFGFWNLSHADGCVPCNCDPMGSLSPFCEPEGGQCECKPGVGGQRCDSCGPGLTGLRLEGTCTPCNCSKEGTLPGTDCDPHTGQCVCKEHVEGHLCDTCRQGYHTMERRNSLGCLPCACDINGTAPEGVCDMRTGQCPCREGVEGMQCTNCAPNYFNTSLDIQNGSVQGCAPCTCDPRGTVTGSVCDSSTGQCMCKPTRYGKDCSACRPGFYLSPGQSMCVECDCHPMGAVQRKCERQTGQCMCAHPSVGGRRCDRCQETFFGFNPGLGRCQPCACDPVGSVNGSCDLDLGLCQCKLLVTGAKCDECQHGASLLRAENIYGCSKAPSQQPAPVAFALSFSSINLTWHQPDSPNSNILNYTLIRDRQPVHSIQRRYPFSAESFTDVNLSPYTNYSYWLITANVAGETVSATSYYQTLAAPPKLDQLNFNLVGRPGPTSASFSWSSPLNNTGPVERFVLSSTESSSGAEPVIHYTGLLTEAVASGLKAFTQYTVTLEACSSGGCTSTSPLSLLTAAAPPQNQSPPKVTATGPHSLFASWEPPVQPNGVITRYELFLRGPAESHSLSTLTGEKRIFVSTGWLDPSATPFQAQLVNGSSALPPESSTVVAGLQAFSTYQMRVASVNMAGSVTSGWSTARTTEGVPELMAPPDVTALSSTSLKVTWNTSEGHGVIARGQVIEYHVNMLTEQTNSTYAPPVVSQVLQRFGASAQPLYIAKGLKPYHLYNFTVTLCTKKGCITSLARSGQTHPAAPTGLSAPRLFSVNESTIEIDWNVPAQLNGPPPMYQVERTDVSLSNPQGPFIRGTRFSGSGYYQFPSDTLPVNTDFTGVELSFKTHSPDGLLLCALSPGRQEEFLAIQIQNGHPYFLFDPQGSVVAVSAQGDGERRYNDGKWHHIIATRRGAVGTIVVNNQYRGSSSASSGSKIIGENTGVFVGGLPKEFALQRKDSGSAQLIRQGFSGCLRDLRFKMTDSPSEQWRSLDWTKATNKMSAYESWEGCPIHTVEGAHFLGHGYLELNRDVFSGGKDFDISMEFRTDQLNALLLFTYNTKRDDYMLVELKSGLLSFLLSTGGHVTELSMWAGLSYCDGDWKQLSLAKHSSLISAVVDDWAEETREAGTAGRLQVDSPLYVGGVPPQLKHRALDIHSHRHGFGGCIRGLTIQSDKTSPPVSQSVNLSVASGRSVRIYLDGCPNSESRYNCRGNDSVLAFTGRETHAFDYSLQPFTEYLYRIIALGAGGWTASPWQRGRSCGKVPSFIPPPSAMQCLNGFSAKVSWAPPIGDVRGVIDRYELRAYQRDQPEMPPIKTVHLANGNFTGMLSGLTPATQYVVTVSACFTSGCTESLGNEHSDVTDLRSVLKTPEEAPDAVFAPNALSSPSALFVTWKPPARPNGVITRYRLYQNNQMVYSGEEGHHNITGLGVYTAHVLLLSACTAVGCTNSSKVTVLTSQLPPGPLRAPTLTLLDSRTILVEWSRPSQVNGALEFYSILVSQNGAEPTIVHNSSELIEEHTLRDLTPGTAYTITVAACTGGGCTRSPSAQAVTEESTPENVPAPLVTPLSPHALHIRWTPPDTPNGIITSYSLWMDSVLIFNASSSQSFFEVTELSPWSRHVLRLQACTARGCGKGPMVEVRTLEMAPEGPILLELTNHSSRSLRARWTAPPRPNGYMSYSLHQRSQDGDAALDAGTAAGGWLTLTDLQPYTDYSFWVEGCNTQGCVESPTLHVTTSPAAPDGLSALRLSHSTSTSLNVSWSEPTRANAPGPLRYGLQMRTSPQKAMIRLLENMTDTFSYNVPGLSPYTEYQFRLVVSHTHGQTAGVWETLRTAEDLNVSGNTTSYTFLHLLPYQSYHLQMEACTSVGCAVSKALHFRTLPAPPEGLPAPHLYSDTPTSVLLSWGAPQNPNGLLERWLIERKVSGTEQISTVGHLPPDPLPLSFLDSSSALSPWTSYHYRLVLQNQAGTSTGPWVGITTRPSRPAGVTPPRVKVLGPESLQVTWSPPLIPNGEIEGYEIRLPVPRIFHNGGNTSELVVTIADLIPYTNYSVSVLVCSNGGGYVGGCTESLPSPATTLATSPQGLAPLSVVAVSESFLAVSWQPPHRPNGPNIRYELLRRKSHQPLAVSVVPMVTAPSHNPSQDLHRWFHVYSGTKLFYQDKGLSRFTQYQYQLVVWNDAGFTSGEIVTAVTMAGIPLQSPTLFAYAVNHTALHANWTPPSLHNLQGDVESYFLSVISANSRQTFVFPPEILSAVVTDLWPRTTYTVSIHVSNGAHNTTKSLVNVTTEDGEPDGMSAPEVVPVNGSAVRVLWSPPFQPNGVITAYRVYVDDRLHVGVDNSSGSYLLGNLMPFTVYNIQVEVCTVYACLRSNVTQTTTVEDLPADMTTPHAQVLSPRVVKLDWSPPGRPNGIILGYDVLKRTLGSCGSRSAEVTPYVRKESGDSDGVIFRCSYLQCPATHHVCGTSCFHPDQQVCCTGMLYEKMPHHYCCAGHYLSFTNSTNPVCCDGKLLPTLPHHHCCGGYYVHLKANEYCCPDHSQGRVSVGPGDSCCGGAPYATKGGQLCCSGSLHDGYRVQCCGGHIVDDALVCCGGAEEGQAHAYIPGFSCCAQEYINSSTSLCCMDSDGIPTIHPSGNSTVRLKCCGSKVVLQEQECCNGIGFDSQRHVCASRPTPGLLMESECFQGALCPVSASSTAYCGSCDIDPSTTACTWVMSAHPDTPSASYSPTMDATSEALITGSPTHANISHLNNVISVNEPSLCMSHEEVVYSGDAQRCTYTDSDLEPFTTYEYRVRGWNSFGRCSSNVITVTTAEDKPWGVPPPRWRPLNERRDVIQWRWQAPARPNGVITHYVILRDGQERYRGDENSFTDVGGIRPFQEFSYQLRACNRAGCTDSAKMVAVTVQGVPEGVQSPVVRALSPSSLHLSWVRPTSLNGRVQQYHLNQTGLGTTIFTHTEAPGNFTLTGLHPFTDYTFVLVACTAVGCGTSSPSTGRTLQASPTGVWSRPRHMIVNASVVELFWDPPVRPNGLVTRYRLRRGGHIIFTGDYRDQNYTDVGLLPNRRYVYELEAITGGGSGLSDKYVIRTPYSCPTGIPAPHNVTVTGPHSISLAWDPPAYFNNSQPVNYNILLNPGREGATIHATGQKQNLDVKGLQPFTAYDVRVQACQDGGCGVGEAAHVCTFEASPQHLSPPSVNAAGSSFLEIRWSPPQKPNGIITSYHIYRSPMETEEELLVFIWSSGPLEFFDASPSLQPFTYYQYRLCAYNSKGSVQSQSTSARTLSARPRNMTTPAATPTGAYSIHLKWSEPQQPNGIISHYKLLYKKHQPDPTFNSPAALALTVEGLVLEATVFGLEPDSEYSLQVEAVNEAGSVSSQWVGARTLEASPAGLANFSVEQKEQGRSLLLNWDPPSSPNGVITMYNLYSEDNLEFSGLSRSFLFRRLEPWTTYTLTLEACTSAGCTRSPPQHVTTAAAPPASQPPPAPLSVGSDHVWLTWEGPAQPNGPIYEYHLLGRNADQVGRGRSREEDAKREKVLFRESSPQENDTFSFTVTGLRPWTRYEFAVRTHNPAGHTQSSWITVTTRQAPPRGLAPPTVSHLQGRPSELVVSWVPPLEPNGVLQSYRIQRNNISFSFSFDPTVLSYTDEDLLPFARYSYSITACTSEGCITSPPTNITTLEAPPTTVEAPTVNSITSSSMDISWTPPPTQNGEVTEYVLEVNNEEAYRGRELKTMLVDLHPHTSYQLVLLACTSGGCAASPKTSTVTEEAPPLDMHIPTLKVTGPESVEVSWAPPQNPNGIITGYELRRDGQVIYVGPETHYHDFTLVPNVEYSYFVRANNSRGAVSSAEASAQTHPAAPSGVGPPLLSPLGPNQVKVEWNIPARPNGDIISYTIYHREPILLGGNNTVYTPKDDVFSKRHTTLQGLAPYRRYEVRVEACTELGCSSSDWASILTPEAPPTGQTAPLLDLQADPHTGLQTTFLLTWSPPAQPNGRSPGYEVYRRLELTADSRGNDVATLVYNSSSTSCKDEGLLPFTAYEYQLWAVNSAGRSSSPWVSGRTGPAPPEGVAPPSLRHVSATTAVVEMRPPARPNGVVSLYRVFSLDRNDHVTLLSEGTSHQHTLHGLLPYTQYRVGVEACTCYQCCSQGPVVELRTLAAPPARQPPPRPVTLTSRSAQLAWFEPLEPNGIIESCELHRRTACPQPPQPVSQPCVTGPADITFFGKRRSYNVTGLQPYSAYELRVACFNNMGSTASNWTTVVTLSEAPQYVSPLSVGSNLTVIWLDWTGSFSLNDYLRQYTVTESQLRIYSGFHSYLHVPRKSEKTLSFQVTCTTDSGSATTPTVRYSPASGLGPVDPEDASKEGASMPAAPVYSELWFILLLALLGLFVLAILSGLLLQRALRKNPSARDRPPLVMLQKSRKAGGETYTFDTVADCVEINNVTLKSYTVYTEGLSDTKIVGGGSAFNPMSVLRVPRQSDLSQAYSHHPLHHSLSQLIDRKALVTEEGCWDNPLGPALYMEEDFADTIKSLSCVRKERSTFTDTHL